ncbi:MAG TPA: hypothetical protein VGO16_06045 [Pseudonocardiaceae bacterium]|jgi:hypothetical protein|nr:hypothetical protein [Pseudonocardiaceae bacterium]
MSDALSFVEIDGQHVELLPARTVLSLFSGCGGCGGPEGGDAGYTGQGGTGGAGKGEAAFLHNWFYIEDGDVYNNVTGATGGSADGGGATGGAGVAK